jgi:hypothetical protein
LETRVPEPQQQLIMGQLPLPTSVELAGWLACLGAAAFLLDRLLRFYKDHMREQPPPAATYVSRDACKLVHNVGKGRFPDYSEHPEEPDLFG